jgi:hypothetical protein
MACLCSVQERTQDARVETRDSASMGMDALVRAARECAQRISIAS